MMTVAAYELTDTIAEEQERVKRKDGGFSQMVEICTDPTVSKRRLIDRRLASYAVAFAAFVVAIPEFADADFLLLIKPEEIPRGHVQHKMLDAIEVLRHRSLLSPTQETELKNWARRFPDPDTNLSQRVERLWPG